MIKVALFASGNGTNAVNLFNYFQDHPSILIDRIYCNNPKAGVIYRSKEIGLPCRLFNREEWFSGIITEELKQEETDFIVLAGFLWLVPLDIISHYKNRIINIHPALLPKYGGKGMYGMKVHESVIRDKQPESGITIHLVNEEYDKGEILLQKKIPVERQDSPVELASKIHGLEYKYFPVAVEKYISDFIKKGH